MKLLATFVFAVLAGYAYSQFETLRGNLQAQINVLTMDVQRLDYELRSMQQPVADKPVRRTEWFI